MSDSDYERAVLWVPDPSSPAGWVRRKVWADEPKRKTKPPMGFGMVSRRAERAGSDDSQQPSA